MRCLLLLFLWSAAAAEPAYNSQVDETLALWSRYKYASVEDGRVVAHDEGGITTSEGQGYGMLRAVWSNDRQAFDRIWAWTREHLQTRPDRLFAWKWQGRVVDINSATDADTDIALALVLAGRRFGADVYAEAAAPIIRDIALIDVAQVNGRYYPTAGNWTRKDAQIKIHLGYLAPYAYEEFATVDTTIPWKSLVASAYEILRWVYFDQALRVPPEFVWLDRKSGKLKASPQFGYDAFPLFWRVALDADWNRRSGQSELRAKMLAFFAEEWRAKSRIFDRYATNGRALSAAEALPLYATVHTLARHLGRPVGDEIATHKLAPLWVDALDGKQLPYYLQNWLWFDRAQDLALTRSFNETLGFLRPFDLKGFLASFPAVALAAALALFLLARFHAWIRVAFLSLAAALCARYLWWRLTSSLNFAEGAGPAISLTLWAAEVYGLVTIALLWLQVGTARKPPREHAKTPDFLPSVDIMVPIYSESLEILEATLVGAGRLTYPNKKVYVCDDSHRESVRALAEELGAHYIAGPKKHAKAGNLNNAMTVTSGELIVVFDTDHIPMRNFLDRTVPPFADERMGVVQTPHVFCNDDIFQRSLRPRRVGNEQDMFNHAIQAGRDHWGGSFFVGSGAVFRRSAIQEVGGFNLLSITEDIHTSQHLHARGWKSAFIDENLAVGLAAENLSSFIVQRRRWMLGCLQIFFKDNPLLVKGLPLRHRLGYAASLSYFFFPLIRVIFWLTPLWYLLFHWHPLLAEVSTLLGFLVPFLVLRPLMTAVLMPGWPRALWGQLYESVCSFTLCRSMLDLFLPKRLGFKVTPKGITSASRSFDGASSKATVVALVINLAAIVKGAVELAYFGIEKEAYFFNIGWAIFNLFFLLAALVVAWERPQRRAHERVAMAGRKARLVGAGYDDYVELIDVGLGGAAVRAARAAPLPKSAQLVLGGDDPLTLDATIAARGGGRVALVFAPLAVAERRRLIAYLFTDPQLWADRHRGRTRSELVMVWQFLAGMVRGLLPVKAVTTTAVLLLALCGAATAHAEGFSEGWYVLRGRANMQIANHKAAAEAFEKAAELNPDNREAQRSLGLAYELQGLTDRAIAQFDRYLARFPGDAEIAYKQAEYLSWSRYDYRRKDAVAYLKMGLAAKEDAGKRHKLARLLGREKATLAEALGEYRRLLEQSPADETMRAEYRKLLSWDKSNLGEAISEYEAFVKAHPDDFDSSYELARLLAQDKSRLPEAAEIYAKLTARRPQDTKLRLEEAHILAAIPGREDAAIAAYEAVLAKKNDVAVRKEMADALAQQPRTRQRALAEYQRILKAQPADERTRVKYGKLLLAERADAPQAAREFERVVQKEPGNAEAHRGAAKAYAWLGDRDMALYHTNKAAAIEAKNPDVQRMADDLRKGREPRVGGKLRFLSLPIGDDRMSGIAAGAFARRDLGPFTTVEAQILGERYAERRDSASGAAAAFAGEARFGETRRVNAEIALYSLGDVSAQTHRLAATFGDKALAFTPGIERRRKEESLLALIGRRTAQGWIGKAREDFAFVDVAGESADGLRFGVTPTAGYVTTADGGRDERQTLDAWAETRFAGDAPWEFTAAFRSQAFHYAEDRSGLELSPREPLPGGFYSPRFAAFETPQLVVRYKSGDDTQAEVRAGPSLQYERTVAGGARTVLGVEASAYAELAVYDNYLVDLTMAYARTPSVPGRVEAGAQIARRF